MAVNKRVVNRTRWLGLVSEYEYGSYPSIRSFCLEHGISRDSFQRWRRIYSQRIKHTSDSDAHLPGFIPVQVDSHPQKESGIRVIVGNGLTIVVDADFDTATLQRLLGAVA